MAWSRASAPREACGLLLGRGAPEPAPRRDLRQGAGAASVERALWGRNLATAADRFELDPEAQLRAERLAAESGWQVLGVWHSHPEGDARASARDRAGAWSGWWYVIVGLGPRGAPGRDEFAAWRAPRDGSLEPGALV